jgi:hypothetical protein
MDISKINMEPSQKIVGASGDVIEKGGTINEMKISFLPATRLDP